MELIGGLIIVGILALGAGAGYWAKRNPAAAPETSGDNEREWMDAIR